MRNQVQLIAYADRLGGTLPALADILDGPLSGLFGGVHVLPFFTPYDGADAGFDPVDHLAVDPRLGNWDDVRRLGASLDTVADVIVNHMSDRSAQFRDVVARGAQSPYAGMFLSYDTVFPHGATEAALTAITRPRPGLPFTPVVLDGRARLVWTTFSSRQIDVNVRHPAVRRYLTEVMRRMADANVAMVRLDAVGYAVKTGGSSCFMTPETVAFIAEITGAARRLGMQTLAEIHAFHEYVVRAAEHVDRVYDFVLAPLILHAVLAGDDRPLRAWLTRRPANCVTVLDTHDGLGMIDAGFDPGTGRDGLLTAEQIDALVAAITRNSGGTSRTTRVHGAHPAVYQISCTAYDAVGGDDRRYLLARLVQLFVPGIPQVYYVGLLAGHNQRPAAGADPREINRRRYTAADVEQALTRPVVRALVRLIRIRTTHPAFGGEFAVHDSAPGELALGWRAPDASADLRISFATAEFRLGLRAGPDREDITDATV